MWRKAFVAALLLLLTSSLLAPTAFAQSPVWSAQYYNNTQLSGTPAFTRQDANIAFNWGTGSPGNGVGNDNFSIRWATDVSLPAGTYRFYAQADDNIRVTFNFGFQPVIDTFASGQVNQLVTGDVNVPNAGTFHIQVDYRELSDQAFAYVSFANLASNPQGPNFPAPSQPQPVPTGNWTAQYFGNNNLTGEPVAILSENSPTHAWGSAAPFTSLPADNFSARWTSLQNLVGGSYNISAQADDGVRVSVNGVMVINEWHAASGQTYNVSINLPPGQNYFQVEYYEGVGDAFITFNLTQTGGGAAPTQQPQQTGASATVTAYRLNVRVAPDNNAQIITRINRLEVYPINGRTADSRWFLINVGGTTGWVAANYINVAPANANIPVVGSTGATVQPPPSASGNQVLATPYNVVIRIGPGTQFRRLGVLPVGGVAPVIGRNSSNTWWQVNFNGLVGWVSAQYAQISPTANVNSIPVTG